MKILSDGVLRNASAQEEAEITALQQAQQGIPSPEQRIAKNAIWERATDSEAEQMEQMLAAQPVRIRRIYDGATHIEPDHELFALLNQALVAAFGPVRAAELLAPSK